jgi:hypothetical protein
MFTLIATSLLFALKTFKKNTLKEKFVYGASILSIAFVFVALIYQYIATGVDMFEFRDANKVSSIISFCLLVFIPVFCYITA